ncbi:MAG: ABC transporter ATP-binding protein [Candidatus Promineifilaceae bacterium]
MIIRPSAASPQTLFEIASVSKRFDDLLALDGVSLSVPAGEVLGVLGPNGAGKTTLFKLIAGFLYPDRGRLWASAGRWPAVGYKPERLLFPGHLRVDEYLELVGRLSNLHGRWLQTAVGRSLRLVGLAEAAGKRIRELSKGMRQRLGLAQALIGEPPLLLLDEPSSGLDPAGQNEICDLIAELHAHGRTIVLASHQLNEVTQVCTQLVILNHGRIHYRNSVEAALAERPRTVVRVDRSLEAVAAVLSSLHPDVSLQEREVVLNQDAVQVRPRVLSVLLGAGYDVLSVQHSHATLAEIYAHAVSG